MTKKYRISAVCKNLLMIQLLKTRAVCDALCEKAPTRVLKIGINDVFGESGPALELIEKYGLDAKSIYEKVKKFVNGV